ncbi:hypothetical protein EV177_010346, partial [Coemansia sp. RSA 1804]
MFQDPPPKQPSFGDLLRSRDTRRELLLERRERKRRQYQQQQQQNGTHPSVDTGVTSADTKGKGTAVADIGASEGGREKGKGKSGASPSGAAAALGTAEVVPRDSEQLAGMSAAQAAMDAGADSLRSRLHATVVREQTLRTALLASINRGGSTARSAANEQTAGTASQPSSNTISNSNHSTGSSYSILGPIPEILLHSDLSAY